MSDELGAPATETTGKPLIWFWIVSAALLIWNIMGVIAYLDHVRKTPEQLAEGFPPGVLEIVQATPFWALGAFAIAVFAGLFGVAGLLLRKRWAKSLFILSLVAVLVQHTWTFVVSDLMDIMPWSAATFPIIVLVICIIQILLANQGIKRGWLR